MRTSSLSPGTFAHSANDNGQWHCLEEHLLSVANLARNFAEPFGAGDWGYLAGLWHDLGKFSREFQIYLRQASSEDFHIAELRGSVDHTTAGAQYAVEQLEVLGHLIAYPIAGHHAGLLDAVSDHACLDKRLSKEIPDWRHGLSVLPRKQAPELPLFLRGALSKDKKEAALKFSFFVRMLFSCLVDADFLDTAAFLDPKSALERSSWPGDILRRMSSCLDRFVCRVFAGEGSLVSRKRAEVREACLAAAATKPGLFSLTVPTGGGKTLASLAFGLRHAINYGLLRIIYVVPFTSIIEQNVQVFREVMAPLLEQGIPDPIVEHHSTIDPEKETVANRLASENWDAPLVVTTTVQFYESLFSNRPSRCRKLHNLVKSVIVLDEVQKLPVEYLGPCLTALKELATDYGTTVVLCTATQPAVHHRENFPIGLEGVREIIPDPKSLYLAFKRTKIEELGRLSNNELAGRLLGHNQVLCILNTRRHARELFLACHNMEGTYHLSAAMCPAHRTEVLEKIKRALAHGDPCRVISTQVVEAGVDLDFPVVYRSLAGLDSISQAAGRCNRNGRAPSGTTYVFRSEQSESEAFLRDTINVTYQILGGENARPLYNDLLSLEAVEHYFQLYYWTQEHRWDKHGILERLKLQNSKEMPFLFDFDSIARSFRLIGHEGETVLIPWGEQGKRLLERLRFMENVVPVSFIRAIQRYSVQVPKRELVTVLGRAVSLAAGSFAVLTCLDPFYSRDVGLCLDVVEFQPETLLV